MGLEAIDVFNIIVFSANLIIAIAYVNFHSILGWIAALLFYLVWALGV